MLTYSYHYPLLLRVVLFAVLVLVQQQEGFMFVSSFTPTTTFTSTRHTLTKLQQQSNNLDPNNDNNNNDNQSLKLLFNLNEYQIDFTKGYLNKHHRNLLILFVQIFTSIGNIQMKKNAFSGGSYEIEDAKLVDITYFGLGNNSSTSNNSASTNKSNDSDNDNINQESSKLGFLTIEATIQSRSEKGPITEQVIVPLDAEPIQVFARQYKNLPLVPHLSLSSSSSTTITTTATYSYAISDLIRRLNRLCYIVKQPQITGKLIQLAYQLGGNPNHILKENLYLNQVPHNRFVRSYFYDMAKKAVLDAVIACSDGDISNRMKLTVLFPEMNPQMDSYR